ncbi:MAG: hypothetical protein ABIU54_08030, partial [Candidatus Eisenbacteria bacterium]
RSGRTAEGRSFMRQAQGDGPAVRRAVAALGSVLPDGLVPLVKRMGWLKHAVARVRNRAGRLDPPGSDA